MKQCIKIIGIGCILLILFSMQVTLGAQKGQSTTEKIERDSVDYTAGAQKGQSTTEKIERDSVDHTAGEIISESKEFINTGENSGNPAISEENMQKLSNTIYNILLVVGIALAVVIGAILGIKFITGGVEAQVDVKKALIPYIVGCVVIFGAFTIWKIVLQILNAM